MVNHCLFCRAIHCASNGRIEFHAKNSLCLILYPKFYSSFAYKKCYAGSIILLCGIQNRTSSSSCTKSKPVMCVQREMLIKEENIYNVPFVITQKYNVKKCGSYVCTFYMYSQHIFTIETLLLTVISQESSLKIPVQCKSVLQCVTLLRLSTLHKEDQNCVQIWQKNTKCSYTVFNTVTFSASAPASLPTFPSSTALHRLQGWLTKILREFFLRYHRHACSRPVIVYRGRENL
jgi:hypothetical protein